MSSKNKTYKAFVLFPYMTSFIKLEKTLVDLDFLHGQQQARWGCYLKKKTPSILKLIYDFVL